MSKCKKCGVEIADRTGHCPLCQHVLEQGGVEGAQTYPDARLAVRKYRFLENLLLFLSIMAESIVVFLNVSLDPEFLWSVIVGLSLIYVNAVVRLAVLGKSGYLFKILALVLLAILVLLGIDYMTGYQQWSLNFVLPIVILCMDAGTLVLMIVNRRNWQSYMMLEILTILLSIVPVILLVENVVGYYYLVFAAFLLSVFLFLGTLILGDRRARNELKRRFHV